MDSERWMKALAGVFGAGGVLLGGALVWRVVDFWGTTPGATADYVLLLGMGIGIACLGLIIARGLLQGAPWAVRTATVLGIMLGVVLLTWAAAALIAP